MAADPATGGAAAFFDLDRTLMQGSSAFQFGRAAFKAGLMSRRQLLADAWANIMFRLRGSSDDDTLALRDRISASLEGTSVRDLERLGPSVLAGVLPRIYPQVLSIAHEHQDAGRRAYITTAASNELAQLLAQVLVLDGGIGSEFSEVIDGVYTGRPTGLFIYGEGKARAIQELARQQGFDLEHCYAYTDSVSDLPMLRLVGHPVAVNPDRELLRTARQEGWEVLRFDRLGRHLKAVVGLAGGAAIGGVVTVMLAGRGRRARHQRPRPWKRVLA